MFALRPQSLAALAAIAAIPLIATPASPSAAPTSAAPLTAPTRASSPLVLSGQLTPASNQSAMDVANSFVAARPDMFRGVNRADLRSATPQPLKLGSLVRYQHVVAGVPVVGRGLHVRIDDRGVVRWVRSNLKALPTNFDLVPTHSARSAIASAPAAIKSVGALLIERVSAPQLAIDANAAGEFRLVWRTDVATIDGRAWRVVVDAKTGTVVSRFGLSMDAQGLVFDTNPVNSPVVERTLAELPDGSNTLADDDHVIINCVAPTECVEAPSGEGGTVFINRCDFNQVASDDNGDFLFPPPDDLRDPTDAFAQTQVYYHLSTASAWLRDHGFAGLQNRQMLSVTNFREPVLCDQPGVAPALAPLDNAFFTPAGLFGDGRGMLVFGQGQVDFAYDGDVVYHELGHAVIGDLSEISPGPLGDSSGLFFYGRSMNEGISDYLAAAISGDSKILEFVQALNPGFPIERDLAAIKRCPDVLTGEVHTDGEPIAAAMWTIRQSLNPSDRPTMDRAVITVIGAIGADDSFESVASALLAELEVVLGPEVAADALAVFEDRGFGTEACALRIVDLATDVPRGPLFLNGDFGTGQSLPGPLQFRVPSQGVVPRLRVVVAAAVAPGDIDAVSFGLLVKGDGSAIAFDSPTDPNSDAIVVHDAAREIELTREPGSNRFVGEIAGPLDTRSGIQLAFFDATPFPWVVQSLVVTTTDGAKTDDAGETANDNSAGCNTSMSDRSGSWMWLLLIGLALGCRRRR